MKGSIYVAMELWGGIFCLIIAFCSAFLWREHGRELRWPLLMELCVACMLFADSVAWFYRGVEGALGILRASNFLSFLFAQLTSIPFTFCLYEAARLRKGAAFRLVIACNAVNCALIGATLFVPLLYYFDAGNFYHRNDRWFWLFTVLTLVQEALNLAVLLRCRRRLVPAEFWALLLMLLLPSVAVAVQLFIYGYSLSNIAVMVGLLVLFFESLRSHSARMARQELTIRAQEDALRDLQTKIALSQIKPHFLYNALNSVYALFGIDVELGRRALVDLADYLRGNMESIESTVPVPLDRELAHVKVYLALEELRFPQKLHVEYDIRAALFTVPALTVQPLVENAVKHGICKKAQGGTVRIGTREAEGAFIITVQDDGVGFDVESFFAREAGAAHVGIRNVRERLAMLCGGTLRITSAVGQGTLAVIEIPKERVVGE